MKNLLLSLVLSLTLIPLQAKTYGIFVDGSYSPGRESTIDRMIDGRLAEADRQMERLSPDSERRKVESKDSLLAALRRIRCECGDEINLVMMGHGNRNNFVFSKSSGSDRTISADELKDALGAAAVECCCKINVVIFACHSGSFQDELFEEEHVQSVYTSSLDNQTSHSSGFFENDTTYVDEGDWMKGFNHDLSKVDSAANMADAFEQAAETARENTPIDFVRVETPTGWRRGDHEVVAHVSGNPTRIRGRWRVQVTYYKPHWMRGQKKYIYFNGEPPERYRRCNWITGTATFDAPDDDVTFTGPTTTTEAPTERIVAHVLGGNRSGLNIHTVKPKWQFCKRQRLRFDNRNQVNRNLGRCNWIDQTVSVTEPGRSTHTGDPINPATPTFRMRFHVERYDPRTGELRGRPQNVDGTNQAHWLDNYRTIQIPPGERGRMRGIRRCDNIFIDVTMSDNRNQPPTGSNIRKVHRDAVNGYSYDIAAHEAFAPSPTLVGTVVPNVTLTNVGSRTMDFAVEAAIGKKGSQNSINAWLTDGNLNAGLWTNTKKVEDLDSAQTVDVSFNHFRFVPETDYIMAFTVRSDADEVENNDSTSINFRFSQNPPTAIPDGVNITAAGTGQTTGHVVTLTVHNTTETAVVLDLGPYVIPPSDDFQGYVIPQGFTVIAPPGERTEMPLDGYCITINSPPVPDGRPTTGIDTWISPSTMPPILLDGENPPTGAAAYQPVSGKKKPDGLMPTIPGTLEDFPWTIDIGGYPDVAAPYIFNATEAISQAYDELTDLDQITTPFNADIFKEKEAVVQHTLWEYTTALEGGSYTLDDFKENSIKEAETVLKQPFDQVPTAVQQEITGGIGSFWNSFEAVGVHAKVLKKD
jgi:hypothetical protein